MPPRSPLHSEYTAIRSAAQNLRQQQEGIAVLMEHALAYPADESMRSVAKACEKINIKINRYVVENRGVIGPGDVRQKVEFLTTLVDQHRAEVRARMLEQVSDDEQESCEPETRPTQNYNPAEFEVSTVFPGGLPGGQLYADGGYLR